jgi:hypothetical protein
MPEALDPFAVNANLIVTPQCFELGAEPAKLVNELADLGNGAGARRIRPERSDHETGHAVPIISRGSDAGVAEEEAKDVALAWRERAIVGQHRSGSAIPCDDLPGGGLDQGGTDLERIEQALQTGCDPRRPCSGPRVDARAPAERDVRARRRSASVHGRSGSTRPPRERRLAPAPAMYTTSG